MSDSTDRPLRVIVADDHPIFLIGLRAVLEQDDLAHVVAEAGNPDALLQALASLACDVLVTDFMMPVERQNDGLRLLQRVRRDFPVLPVIVVTTLSNAGLFQSMLDLGVRGLLSKASLAGELPAAVRGALRGEVFVADSVRRVLREAQQYGPDALLAAERLSPRELEVLRLFSAGHTVGQIAAQLNRSKQTVSAQKVGAMRKLGLANDAALFIYLQESGMS
ncbi:MULTISPECIES: response regulator transcription factor [Pseudomonas syringae group]|uniref:DNA-binding response regulator, LuxR protein n=1 Tax=Pseudomonas syringae pv. maculicola TaxID=59511 RepID=A0A0N0G2U7_PSEYM|nr:MULTISPECIES: response regulator transcription factor [Pseudomonas syringae group]KPC05437.1 DNA-binding response regulator [Pseudomonas amygdali pv. lachrymans]EGH96368.1 DNA-binding response regulator, LuxR family protein [Pseudomonas amygdali pv. lachrymans str. M302278]KKI27196.1 LuxR family transcriptional regulator [Pseudomonas syringae pv. persicae]KPB89984.1 DNA-binding response regulator [Pseudomonas syringae pv. maculicola]KPC05856.1 DNA-binding response regulator [Pseudomonas syr